MDRRSTVRVGGTLRACLALASLALTLARGEPAVAQATFPDPETAYNVPLDTAPTRGSASALVTIVMLGDFACPFTRRSLETIAMLRALYGDDLRIAFKALPLPFRPQAEVAAEAALAARAQDKFWEYHDILFAHQHAQERADLERYAAQLSLDMDAFRHALDTIEYRAELERNMAFARSLKSIGTPGFFINGRLLRGAQPLHVFVRVIDEELARARALVAAGTPREQVYARSIAGGKKKLVELVGEELAAAKQLRFADAGAKALLVPPDAPTRGGREPTVVIQVLGNFESTQLREAQPMLRALEKEYGDSVQLVWRNNAGAGAASGLRAAEAAAEVLEQAGREAFWSYHDLLLANQHQLTPSDLVSHARKVKGVDPSRVESALASCKHKARVIADYIDILSAGPIGPAMFSINGSLVNGWTDEDLDAAMNKALADGWPTLTRSTPLPPASPAAVAHFERDLPPDDVIALFERACDGGALVGCLRAAREHLKTARAAKRWTKGLALMTKACQAGLANACTQLALEHAVAKRTPVNRRKALHFYAKGCDGDDAAGCYFLGAMHDGGIATPADAAKAETLYKKGCSLGNEHACEALEPAMDTHKYLGPALPGRSDFTLELPSLLEP